MQKKLDINIENYKRRRGIYKEIGNNGKGKEYDYKNGKLIFEGEYLNGERLKGKTYIWRKILIEKEINKIN